MTWMIYGAYGYTGELVTEEALRRGHRPVLAGRSPEKLVPLASRLDLDYIVADLANEAGMADVLGDVDLVFHAAGPFVYTSEPMIRACITAGTHYVDITGEIDVLETTFAYDEIACDRGIVLISGAGFDVVPTDCLAVYVAEQVPNAIELAIAFAAIGTPSAGTTKTMLEGLPAGNYVRRDGKLVAQPFGDDVRSIQFSDRERTAVAIPWGDLATAYRSTEIPNITTYMAYPESAIQILQRTAPIAQRILDIEPVREALQTVVDYTMNGPTREERQKGRSYVWAEARGAGGSAEAWLETLETYRFTAVAGIRIVEHILDEQPYGALTPAQAFGADFVLELPETRRYDTLPST